MYKWWKVNKSNNWAHWWQEQMLARGGGGGIVVLKLLAIWSIKTCVIFIIYVIFVIFIIPTVQKAHAHGYISHVEEYNLCALLYRPYEI